MDYLTLKWIHILSSTLLFGTGIGLAFFFFVAHRMKNLEAMKFATRTVVLGDFLFTTPSGIVQLVTGLLLAYELGIAITETWLLVALVLFFFAGACWIPVLKIQIKMRDLAANVGNLEDLPQDYQRLYKTWNILGTLAFPSLVAVFWLMVTKPEF